LAIGPDVTTKTKSVDADIVYKLKLTSNVTVLEAAGLLCECHSPFPVIRIVPPDIAIFVALEVGPLEVNDGVDALDGL
jgi:hypothetical protein